MFGGFCVASLFGVSCIKNASLCRGIYVICFFIVQQKCDEKVNKFKKLNEQMLGIEEDFTAILEKTRTLALGKVFPESRQPAPVRSQSVP